MLHRLLIKNECGNIFLGKSPKKHITYCYVCHCAIMVSGEGEEGTILGYIQIITLELNWHHRTAWEVWEGTTLWCDVALGLWKANMSALLCHLHLKSQLKSILKDNSKERERRTKKGQPERSYPSHNAQVGKALFNICINIHYIIQTTISNYT